MYLCCRVSKYPTSKSISYFEASYGKAALSSCQSSRLYEEDKASTDDIHITRADEDDEVQYCSSNGCSRRYCNKKGRYHLMSFYPKHFKLWMKFTIT